MVHGTTVHTLPAEIKAAYKDLMRRRVAEAAVERAAVAVAAVAV